MTETSLFWTDDGGDSGPYSADETRDIGYLLGGLDRDDAGRIMGVAASLWCVTPVTGQVRVLPGSAVVDGTLYVNDDDLDFTPTTPSVGTTGKRIVLRKEWDDKTVRATVIASSDGVATIPTPEQVEGTRWEIPLCQFEQTVSGSIQNLKNDGDSVSAVRALRQSWERVILGDLWMVGPPPNDAGEIDGRWEADVGEYANISRIASVSPARWQLSTGDETDESVTIRLGALGQGDGAIAPEHNPTFVAHTQFPSNADMSFFLCGFFAAVSSTPNGAYLRRTASGDVEFVTRQGGSETTTTISQIGSSDVEIVEIRTRDNGTSWQCLRNGVQVASHSADVPTATSALAAGVALETGADTEITADLEHLWVDAQRFTAHP
ncbi:MAG: hypothetical protein ACOC9T_00015 [Myxococcota bacterium]